MTGNAQSSLSEPLAFGVLITVLDGYTLRGPRPLSRKSNMGGLGICKCLLRLIVERSDEV